jgi:hypothetical protein
MSLLGSRELTFVLLIAATSLVVAGQVTGPAAPPTSASDRAGSLALAADTGRLPSYDGVPAPALARADELLARYPAVSLHDHPVRLPDPLTPQTWQAWLADGREQLGYAGLAGSGWVD